MYKQNTTILIAAILLLVVAPIAVSQVQTEPQPAEPSIIFFEEEGCPACAQMKELLNALVADHGEIVIVRYDISDPGAIALLIDLAARHGVLAVSVPMIFIGDGVIIGAGRAEEFQLRTAVSTYIRHGGPSPLAFRPEIRFPWRDFIILGVFGTLLLALVFLQGG